MMPPNVQMDVCILREVTFMQTAKAEETIAH